MADRAVRGPRSATRTTSVALAATLGLAGASWVVAIRLMSGMGMGTGTRLGSFWPFIMIWAAMMVAMMLPGAAPALVRLTRSSGRARAVLQFLGAYLGIWAVVGLLVYAVDRPHGTLVAGLVVIAAGGYELTPVKKHCRQRCRESIRSGAGFGLYCAGSSIGLMAVLVALGVMTITWMVGVAIVVLAQKALPARAAIDLPLALALCAFGVLIILAPSAVPGLTPPM